MKDYSYWPLKESESSLPHSFSNIPILGYKRCSLQIFEDDVILGSYCWFDKHEKPDNKFEWEFEPYEVESTYRPLHASAWSHRREGFESCSCGFYSFNQEGFDKNLRKPPTFYSQWETKGAIRDMGLKALIFPRLLVELSGTVVRCQYGYRSTKQRLLKVYIEEVFEAAQFKTNPAEMIQNKYGIPVVNTIEELMI